MVDQHDRLAGPIRYVECTPGCKVCAALAHASVTDKWGQRRPVVLIEVR